MRLKLARSIEFTFVPFECGGPEHDRNFNPEPCVSFKPICIIIGDMIKVTFLYPRTEGSWFDFEYYLTKHLKLSREVFQPVLRGLEIDRGVSGIDPESAAPFHAAANLLFDSADDFYGALMPRLEELKADAGKYSNTETVILISEVLNDS